MVTNLKYKGMLKFKVKKESIFFNIFKLLLIFKFRRELQYDSKYPMNFNVSSYHCWVFNYPKLTNKLKKIKTCI